MQLTLVGSHLNTAFVRPSLLDPARSVDNIVFFDATGVLLDTEGVYLESRPVDAVSHNGYYHTTRVDTLPGADAVPRRKVDFSRVEHFYTNVKGHITLYICAGLFDGYSTVGEEVSHVNPCTYSYMRFIDIHASVNGEPAAWHRIRARYTHRQEDRSNATAVRAVMAHYNKHVGSGRQAISEYGAAELIAILPELTRLASLK